MTLAQPETNTGPIVAGVRLSRDDHPNYRQKWSVQSSVRAFTGLALRRGVIFSEVQFGGGRAPVDGWRGSDLKYCRRKSMLNRLQAPKEEPTESSKGKFMFGHMIESVVVAALRADPRIEFLDAQGDLFDAELNLHGHHDGRIRIVDTTEDDDEFAVTHIGRVEVIEIKSINSNAMRYAKELPRDYHVAQVCSYVMMMRRAGVRCDGGRVIYVSKDNWLLEERLIGLTPSRERIVLDEIDALNELYERGDLPRRLPSKPKTFQRGPRKGTTVIQKAWKCGYCELANTVCFRPDGKQIETVADVLALRESAESSVTK